jgi:hypothetical protein
MGVISPEVAITARAAESLEKLRSTLGEKVGLELLVDAKNSDVGKMMIKFENLGVAEKMSKKTAAALDEAGFKVKGEMKLLTSELPRK